MDFVMESLFDEEQHCWLVSITGEVDIFNSNEMKTKLLELWNERQADLVIDCKTLEYIDSTALGALVAVLKNVRSNDSQVHLRNVRPNLLKLFRITNLDKVFVMDGEADAK